MLSVTSTFFFYSDDDHPDLHSFPTRRSSDLDGFTQLAGWGATKVWLLENAAFAPYRSEVWAAALSELAAAQSPKAILDRKSTRLNSSHSSISYAVFCLKKKK